MPDCRRLVVVVAHPHEELCAAGGLLHDLALQGVPVSVLAVTDTGAPTSTRPTTPWDWPASGATGSG
jgi:LmbE family N-acetylglucosaminyl deacetylase